MKCVSHAWSHAWSAWTFRFSLTFSKVSKNVVESTALEASLDMLFPHFGGNQGLQIVQLESSMNQNLESWTEQLPPLHSSGIQICTPVWGNGPLLSNILRKWESSLSQWSQHDLNLADFFSCISTKRLLDISFLLTWRKAKWGGMKEAKMQRSWMAQGLGWVTGTVREKC